MSQTPELRPLSMLRNGQNAAIDVAAAELLFVESSFFRKKGVKLPAGTNTISSTRIISSADTAAAGNKQQDSIRVDMQSECLLFMFHRSDTVLFYIFRCDFIAVVTPAIVDVGQHIGDLFIVEAP